MSRINFFVNTLMWWFRILRLSQACILVIWSSRLCSEAAGKTAVFSRFAAGRLSYGRLEDLTWNVFYVENLKYIHSISIHFYYSMLFVQLELPGTV